MVNKKRASRVRGSFFYLAKLLTRLIDYSSVES